MLRGLYRFYLYTVCIAMLIFAASGAQRLLQVLFAQTLFKEPSSISTNVDIIQAIVFAIVSWITAVLLGGLHYWLIRRDMHSDPDAGNGGIRAFFLNFAEAVSLPLAVGTGAFLISSLGQQNSFGASFSAAFTIATLAFWAALEWERRRVPANSGAAIVFQRLHLYGVQLVLLFILTFNWLSTVGILVDDLFFGGRGLGTPVCGGFTACQGPNLLSQIVGTLWTVLFWLGYGFLSRNDTPSLLRRVLHLISFAYGLIFILIGIYRAASLLLLSLFKVAVEPRNISGPFAEYDVLSPLILGILVVVVYVLWLRRAIRQQPAEKVEVTLTLQAIACSLMGAAFWWGCGLVILNLLEKVAPSNTPLNPENWATALAFIITGIAYFPLDILLRQRSIRAAFPSPLRGFVFALLGVGILAGAIGGASALYAYGTFLLRSPFDNWPYTAHAGTAAFAVGVIIAAIYLWTGFHQGLFSRHVKQPEPVLVAPSEITPQEEVFTPTQTTPVLPDELSEITLPRVPTPNTSSLIGDILDKLVAGKISRDEAIIRIEILTKKQV